MLSKNSYKKYIKEMEKKLTKEQISYFCNISRDMVYKILKWHEPTNSVRERICIWFDLYVSEKIKEVERLRKIK